MPGQCPFNEKYHLLGSIHLNFKTSISLDWLLEGGGGGGFFYARIGLRGLIILEGIQH